MSMSRCAALPRPSPAWRGLKPLERGRIMLKLAERINADAEALAAIEVRDSGKPTALALGDVRGAARYFEYYGGMADKLQGETIPLGDDYVSYTRREPFGVVGAIIPWNGPDQPGRPERRPRADDGQRRRGQARRADSADLP